MFSVRGAPAPPTLPGANRTKTKTADPDERDTHCVFGAKDDQEFRAVLTEADRILTETGLEERLIAAQIRSLIREHGLKHRSGKKAGAEVEFGNGSVIVILRLRNSSLADAGAAA